MYGRGDLGHLAKRLLQVRRAVCALLCARGRLLRVLARLGLLGKKLVPGTSETCNFFVLTLSPRSKMINEILPFSASALK